MTFERKKFPIITFLLLAQNHKTHLFDYSTCMTRSMQNRKLSTTGVSTRHNNVRKTCRTFQNRESHGDDEDLVRFHSLQQRPSALPMRNRKLSITGLHSRDNEVRKACWGLSKTKMEWWQRDFVRCHSQRNVKFRPSDSESLAEHNGPTHERQRGQVGLPGHLKTKIE